MKNISDLIEEFILEQLLYDNEISLSRNDLANYFNCAPSQINYVLTTRFTPIRGFDIESKRGGGGFIKINKITLDDENIFLQTLLQDAIGNSIDYNSSLQILDNLKMRQLISQREYNIIKSAISDKALSSPIKIQDSIRAKILKNILWTFLKEE